MPWANNATAIEDGDIAKANETLEKAGWVDSDGDGIREKNGTKASFELYYSSDAPERQAIAVSVSEQAKEMGIEVKAIGSNWDEMDGVKNSQAIVWGFGSTDPSTIWSEYHSSQAGVGNNNPALTMHLNNHVKVHIPNGLKQFGTAVMVFHHKVTHHGYGSVKSNTDIS